MRGLQPRAYLVQSGFLRLSPISAHALYPSLGRLSSCAVSTWSSHMQPAHRWFSNHTKSKVVIIAGCTGIGKTNVALRVAKALDGEIICGDTVQLYRNLPIVSNSGRELEGVAHHLFNSFSPTEQITVNDYVRLAKVAIMDILSRGKTPIVVGGAAFYLRGLTYGLPEVNVPPGPDYVEAGQVDDVTDWSQFIEASATNEINEYLTYFRDTNDYFRLNRGIHIVRETGGPPQKRLMVPELDALQGLDYDFRCFFMYPWDRIGFNRHLDARSEDMVERGLLEETLGLGEELHDFKQKTIGLRQSLRFLHMDSFPTYATFLDFMDELTAANRKYAKRQMGTARSEHLYEWVGRRHTPDGSRIDPANEEAQVAAVSSHVILVSKLSGSDFWTRFYSAAFRVSQAALRKADPQHLKESRTYRLRLEQFGTPKQARRLIERVAHFRALQDEKTAWWKKCPDTFVFAPTSRRDQPIWRRNTH